MGDNGTLVSFLRRFTTKDNDTITHTRIGNIAKGGKIYPGKYSIPDDKRDEFFKVYNKYLVHLMGFLLCRLYLLLIFFY